MSGVVALQRLLTWLSPAFPTGSFAWSGGLETAIADRRVRDATTLRDWVLGNLVGGGLRTDGIVLAEAWRAHADDARLAETADLCLALIPAAERRAEVLTMGEAFVSAAAAWPNAVFERLPRPCPYAVAVGAIAAAHGIALDETAAAFLVAAVQTQVSVAVRLVPLGQSAGLAVIAALEPRVTTAARAAAASSLADIGGIAYAADIAAMAHQTLEPRLFRS